MKVSGIGGSRINRAPNSFSSSTMASSLRFWWNSSMSVNRRTKEEEDEEDRKEAKDELEFVDVEQVSVPFR